MDLGATTHTINDMSKLSYVESLSGNDMIFVGNGNALPMSHVGDACVFTKEGKFKLNDVLVVPH